MARHTGQFVRKPILWVLLFGFLIRLYAGLTTGIINPDGVLYIRQAKAIYYQDWSNITTCSVSYVSSLPVLIALTYDLFQDWIAAGRAICLAFGFASLVPLYFILRRFFNELSSATATLVYALVPILTSRSAGVVRDPVCWFFTLFGIMAFLFYMDGAKTSDPKNQNRNDALLVLTGLSFLLATWARIETLLLFMLTFLFLAFPRKKFSVKSLVLLISPWLVIAAISVPLFLLFDLPAADYLRLNEFKSKLTEPMDHYLELREDLEELSSNQGNTLLGRFIGKARNTVWLIALGTLLNSTLEAFFYPYFLICVIGMYVAWKHHRQEPRIQYLFLLTVSSLPLLYIHTIHIWILDYRFMVIVLLPACVFTGYGVEKISQTLGPKLKLGPRRAMAVTAMAILLIGIPKNSDFQQTDKFIFKQIGLKIASIERFQQPITIAADQTTTRKLVTFYANLNYPGATCSEFYDRIPASYPDFLNLLKERQIKYFLWIEKAWPADRFNFFRMPNQDHFKELGRWYHRDTQQVILWQVLPASQG